MRWSSLHVSDNSVTHFDTFGVEQLFAAKYHDKYLQNTGLLIHIGFMADFTSLFSPHIFEKNDKVIPNYFLK